MKRLIFSLIFVCGFMHANNCQKDEVQVEILILKDSIPMKIDNVTTLIDVTCENNVLLYTYNLDFNKTDKRVMSNKKVIDMMQNRLSIQNIDFYCNSDFTDFYRMNNINMKWVYFDENKEELMSIEASNNDCKN
ncbi:hypothetical protein [Helicobacter sp. MIT 99-5507]|uniref:hypothetical protein n=1 Tax=Helicobacter sp. MIT 99-5507 TaxID=152489 RepID=UPI000E1EE361|nr:hypothetical protein [Helicobacter sp. MIT 99-5507]RDU58097.1 hypothetical protein CQA42_04140 [Helicobacter sp. MIT 99-5507]